MQWLITIAVVLTALALVVVKLYRFAQEIRRIDSADSPKPGCHGCPGSSQPQADLGITIKPLVQLGDKTKQGIVAIVFLSSC
ncbi:MAG: hypothetical protein ACKN82_21745, partial [Pirellula sp.]